MQLEDLEKTAQEDLQWDISDCDIVCLKIPSLKAKWCAMLYKAEIESKSISLQLKAVYARLHEAYLSGNKINTIVDRRDVDIYITGDDKYIAIYARQALAKETCKYIEGVLRGIDSMSFSISSAVKWHVFKNGG